MISSWLSEYGVQVLLSVAVLCLYFVSHGMVIPRLEASVEKGQLKSKALRKAVTIFRLLNGVLSLAVVMFVWGFDFQWLIALSSGIIAITGVALFASWSILSNITAFFILLTQDSFRRGNFVRVIDADNYVEGTISEINIFHTVLITENREYITYPNNLLIARPTLINPRSRYTIIGKIQEFTSAPEAQDRSQ